MNEKDDSTIGAGHLEAMGRLGLSELRNSLYPESNVAQHYPEQGLYGTATPQEVMEGKRADGLGLEEPQGSILAERMRAADRAAEVPQERSQEMERDQ